MLLNVTILWSMGLTIKASDFYYLGDYTAAASSPVDQHSAAFVLAAAAFRGDHKTTRRLFKEYKSTFSTPNLVFANFHLGISLTRTSDYKEAKEVFLENWKLRNEKELTGVERFFVYQGLSFFRFFFSKHESSLFFANIAEGELLRESNVPALLITLVHDLIAHNYFQLGRPAKGEVFLKKAIQAAKKNNFKILHEEFSASLVIYRSQYSTNINKNITDLKKLLKRTSESNDYTCSELVLQISKLYLIKGAYKEANDYLIKNFNTIYKNDNKRKVAKLNTLLAQLLLPKRQFIEALSLLKVAKSNLSDDVDFNLLAPVLGTEKRVLKSLGQDTADQEERLNRLLGETDKGMLKQIEARESTSPLVNEEDQLGLLFDKATLGDDSVLSSIIEYELYHIARIYFSPLGQKKSIVLHPQNKGVFLFSEDDIQFVEVKISKNQLKFLTLINIRPHSKEELIKEIWGYSSYDPLRHDHLVYTLVRRLRKLLGDKRGWIQVSEDQYFLERETEVLLKSNAPEKERAQSEIKDISDYPEDINFRQIQILDGALGEGFSANYAADFFETTRMTSYRDLNDLLEKGLLLKRGKGRATRYFSTDTTLYSPAFP